MAVTGRRQEETLKLRTKWNEIFPKKKTEYDLAEEDLESNYHGPKYY